MNSILCAGKELQELKCGLADCWVLYVIKGEADFISGPNVCRAGAGYAVIINVTSNAVQIKASENFESYVLQIVDADASELARQHMHLMEIPDESISVIHAGKQRNNILAVFQNITAQINNEDAAQELLQELMVRLYRASLKIPAGIQTSRLSIVADLQDRLKREYGKDFTLEGIAAEYRISVSYLSHVFREATGVPIMRYLLSCRINAAKECLEQSVLSISEIAQKCGFHDISNFGRTFRKETGYSPREYRKQFHMAPSLKI